MRPTRQHQLPRSPVPPTEDDMTRSPKPRKPRKPTERCAGKCRHRYCAGYDDGYADGQVDTEPTWLPGTPAVRREMALKQTKERR